MKKSVFFGFVFLGAFTVSLANAQYQECRVKIWSTQVTFPDLDYYGTVPWDAKGVLDAINYVGSKVPVQTFDEKSWSWKVTGYGGQWARVNGGLLMKASHKTITYKGNATYLGIGWNQTECGSSWVGDSNQFEEMGRIASGANQYLLLGLRSGKQFNLLVNVANGYEIRRAPLSK